MQHLKLNLQLASSFIIVFAICSPSSFADVISPSMDNQGQTYSTATPDSSYFGTGPAGRLSEASMLRFKGEQCLDDGKLDQAIAIIGKAVQLDAGDPDGHMLYARAITAKFYQGNDKIDEKLLSKAIREWQMIWHHDADASEQAEAKYQCRKLMHIAKALNKRKLQEDKQATAIAERDPQAVKPYPQGKTKTEMSLDEVQEQDRMSTLSKLKDLGQNFMDF
jgi:hypothetical protein